MKMQSKTPDIARRTVLGGAAAAGAALCLPPGAALAADGFNLFMDRSEALTGVKPLDRTIGRTLYGLLNADGEVDFLTSLRPSASGPPGRIHKVELRIISAWYSGVVTSKGGPRQAAYEDALMWQQLHFTTPMGLCGGEMGFWKKPPKA